MMLKSSELDLSVHAPMFCGPFPFGFVNLEMIN